MKEVIFNIMKRNAHTWVRYWKDGLHEHIELRSNFITGQDFNELKELGFVIHTIKNADSCAEILFIRENN